MTHTIKLAPHREAIKEANRPNSFVGILTGRERLAIRDALKGLNPWDELEATSDYGTIKATRDGDERFIISRFDEEGKVLQGEAIPTAEMEDAITYFEEGQIKNALGYCEMRINQVTDECNHVSERIFIRRWFEFELNGLKPTESKTYGDWEVLVAKDGTLLQRFLGKGKWKNRIVGAGCDSPREAAGSLMCAIYPVAA